VTQRHTIRLGGLICLTFAVAGSAMATKISVSTSSYGVGETMVTLNASANIDGYSVFEGYFASTSPPTGATIFDYTILGAPSNFDFSVPLANLDTLYIAQPYGVLGCDDTNDPNITAGNWCVENPDTNSVVQAITYPGALNTSTLLTFQVPGNGQGVSFFVAEDLSSAPTSAPTPTITLAGTPEPRLWPILGLGLVGLVLLRRFRSAKLA
jgi:hypothetical protein